MSVFPTTTPLSSAQLTNGTTVPASQGNARNEFALGTLSAWLSTVSTILTGELLYVDSVNGNDSTGVIGQFNRPFLTLTAAKTAALSGDTIVVRPGTYNERNLLKDGVNWIGLPGANINYTGAEAIFDDSSTGTNGAVTCTIEWSGDITWSGTTNTNFGEVVNLSNASSSVRLNCTGTISSSSNGNTGGPIVQTTGTLYLRCAKISVSGTSHFALRSCIWWFDGNGFYDVDYLHSDANSGYAYYTTGSGTGQAFLYVNLIEAIGSQGVCGVANQASTTTARSWVIANEILVTGNASAFGVYSIAGKLYVTAQKISGTGGSFYISNLDPLTNVETWLQTEKATNDFRSGGGFGSYIYDQNVTGGLSCWVDVGYFEDLQAGGVNSYTLWMRASGARITVQDMVMGANTNFGLKFDAGIFSGRIDGTAATSGNPVLVNTTALGFLERCTLLGASGRDAITATSAKTVNVIGDLSTTPSISSNVSFAGAQKNFIDGPLAIGTTQPNAAAILQTDSTTQGFLLSRMTTTQKNAISSPPEGLLVYDTTLHAPCFWNGSTWKTIATV